jgi:hypothetical protein
VPIPFVGPAASIVIGSLVMITLLIALYRFVPHRTFSVRDVVPGALIAGVLIEILTLAFPLYARIAGGFNTYGAQFGLFFLLATWFYLLSQLILLGAVLNKFRLGEPTAPGLFSSPMQESPDKADARPLEGPRRSVFQRVALGVVLAAAVAANVVRRRRSRTAA